MSRPIRIECDVKTGTRKEIELTDEEIAQAQIRSAAEAQQMQRDALAEQARSDLIDYLMDFVASRPDAPRSIKDYVDTPRASRERTAKNS